MHHCHCAFEVFPGHMAQPLGLAGVFGPNTLTASPSMLTIAEEAPAEGRRCPRVTSTGRLGFCSTTCGKADISTKRLRSMTSLSDSLGTPRQQRSSGLATALAAFIAGLVVGLGLVEGLGKQFAAGMIILASLCIGLWLLQRVAEKNRKRITAGEASYRAFFDHAVEGIFRTTPEGHYLAVNQALADIYGYPDSQMLIDGLTDIGAQLYVEPGRRDEFRLLMQSNDVVTNF